MKEIEQDWLFTFGPDHLHPETGMSLGRHYIRLRGTCDGTRGTMLRVFGNRWSQQYTVERFNSRPRLHNLIEIPLPA